MPSYGNFQSDNQKYTRKTSRVNVNNPDFTPAIDVNGEKEKNAFDNNLHKWERVVSYLRFNPDVFYDLITPKSGGIRLDLDQRVFLRAVARFPEGYYTFGRAYGKTLLEVMAMFYTAIFYPRVKLSLTAQSLKTAAKLLKEKYDQILEFYPLMKNEIYNVAFRDNFAEIEFHNGSKIDALANSQTSKGLRRHRGSIEEDNLVDEATYRDAVKPIFDDPRRTIGEHPQIDPNENNSSAISYTTTGYRASPAHIRCQKAFKHMINLEGSIMLGASWKLAAFNGRGKSISEIMKEKRNGSPITFDMNYMARWTGAGEDGLCNIAKVLECRNLTNPEFIGEDGAEYVMGIDVARSEGNKSCLSIVTVVKIIRSSNGRVKEAHLVNLFPFQASLSFTAFAIEIQRLYNKFNPVAIIVDDNGLGKGIADELLKAHIDPLSGEELPCLDTINTNDEPEKAGSPKVVFCYIAQSFDKESIPNFMDFFETGKIRLLQRKDAADFVFSTPTEFERLHMPYLQTDFLIDEISNLRLKYNSNGSIGVEQATRSMNHDRYSALQMPLWYIKKYLDKANIEDVKTDEAILAEIASMWL